MPRSLRFRRDWLRALPVALLAVVLAVIPFPWGAVLPGGALRLELMAYAIGVIAVVVAPRRIGAAWWPVAFGAVLAIYAFVQLVPLPVDTLGAISPTAAHIYSKVNAILGSFESPAVTPRISIAPEETRTVGLLTAAFVSLFVAGLLLCATRPARRFLAWTIVVIGALHVIGAMLWETLGAPSPTALGRLHGVFINPNHFAGYLEIALFVAFALVWTEIVAGRERIRYSADVAVRLERRIVRLMPSLLLFFVIVAGIVQTQSRGGIAAGALVLALGVVMAVFHATARRRRSQYALAAVGAAAGAAFFLSISTGTRPLLRFLAADPRDPAAGLRPRLWELSVDVWRQFPLVGSGLGSFREAFRRVQPRDLRGLAEQAHNEPLQMLVTGGVIGLAIASLLVASLFIVLIRGWWKQRHREEAAFALAGFLALLSLLVHGIVEFNFSIPAIPATLAAVLGWAVAASQDESPPRMMP
ncbi:MAG: O-antigen ligase family protein [Thermoanaerobaculia bacterium]